ncbi:anti-lipopolysaccharide factor like protein [Penaeus vannamei]|uniref:Anti-lipopolysaccharide factor like protein n=1 Tax=Penaeus vannamei TaxID=6689 RepID=A0A3R7PB52_PENVA|nr:anti-lipopolysaccharide factor like protein [Penaeus vannamei]
MTPPYLLVALAWVAAATIASGTPRTLEASFVGHSATTKRTLSRCQCHPGSGEVKVVKRSAQFQARARYLPQNIVTVLETACVETTTVAVPLESLVFPMPCVCDLCSYTPSSEVCNCLRAPECRANIAFGRDSSPWVTCGCPTPRSGFITLTLPGSVQFPVKDGEIELLGHYCSYSTRPYFLRWRLKFKSKVWCPGWTLVYGSASESSSVSNSIQNAIINFIQKAYQEGVITEEDAKPWLQGTIDRCKDAHVAQVYHTLGATLPSLFTINWLANLGNAGVAASSE